MSSSAITRIIRIVCIYLEYILLKIEIILIYPSSVPWHCLKIHLLSTWCFHHHLLDPYTQPLHPTLTLDPYTCFYFSILHSCSGNQKLYVLNCRDKMSSSSVRLFCPREPSDHDTRFAAGPSNGTKRHSETPLAQCAKGRGSDGNRLRPHELCMLLAHTPQRNPSRIARVVAKCKISGPNRQLCGKRAAQRLLDRRLSRRLVRCP